MPTRRCAMTDAPRAGPPKKRERRPGQEAAILGKTGEVNCSDNATNGLALSPKIDAKALDRQRLWELALAIMPRGELRRNLPRYVTPKPASSCRDQRRSEGDFRPAMPQGTVSRPDGRKSKLGGRKSKPAGRKSKPPGRKSKSGGRKSKSHFVHESCLFNGLSPNSAGGLGDCARFIRAPLPES